jgi:FkbH-like protein
MIPPRPAACLVVSSFNATTFARYLENDPEEPQIQVTVAPFGQVVPSLLQEGLSSPRSDFLVAWTEPQEVLPSVRRALDHEVVDVDEVLHEVEVYAGYLKVASRHTGSLFVPSWQFSERRRDFGFFELGMSGPAYLLHRANARLAEALDGMGAHLLDAQPWIEAAGLNARSSQLRYMAKTPFSHAVFEEAAIDVRAALRGVRGLSRKLVIVDLDDTLWGGVVGDVGWEKLRLGGHDAIGEAFADFQRGLKALTRRGVILGVVSKNDEAVAKEVFERHPEMVLRLEDLAGWEISWSDKAERVAMLAERLNLGLESVVFVDDNPVERSRVKEALPAVLVPDWPSSPMMYRQALLSLRCFASSGLTKEDRGRSQAYSRAQTATAVAVGDLDTWLDGLGLSVAVSPLLPENLARATQLLNKTNQMNLSTRRMPEAQFLSWASEKRHSVWTLTVSDRLGDSGLTGLVSLDIDGPDARVVDFILSCRVMGRRIEETLLFVAVELSRAAGASSLTLRHIPTDRNGPCLAFLKTTTLQRPEEGTFSCSLDSVLPSPRNVAIKGLGEGCGRLRAARLPVAGGG